MTLGLFIGRLNPPHIWHLWIIDKALLENDKVLLLIWISNKIDLDNPLTFEERRELLEYKYKWINNLVILPLEDTPTDEEWVKKILKILDKNFTWIKEINFYWWDFENDSAFRAIKEYENIIDSYNINYIEVFREKSYIEYNGDKYLVSSTNLRKALREWNFWLAEQFMDNYLKDKIISYFKR